MVAVLALGCATPAGRETALDPVLGFDAEPASATFGQLQVAARGNRAWGASERARVDSRLRASEGRLERTVAVWTGAVGPSQEGCRHPADQSTVLGRVRVADHGLLFEPSFPWVAGLDYTACLDTRALQEVLGSSAGPSDDGGSEFVWLTFALPPPPALAPRVTAIWPDIDVVPANLLRFYVLFSEPMHRRGVAGRLRLLDARGEPIAEPFVDIPDGLWDTQGRRLTVFMHPGRIKRGVGPRQALGAALREGEEVVFEVDAGLETVHRVALGEHSRRSYRVGAADRTVPDPEGWTVYPPSGPHQPLKLEFDEPLDPAQLATAVSVWSREAAVAGSSKAEAAGRVWSFSPAEPWRPGRYTLAVGRSLEDLAGNTMDRRFDVETAPAAGADESAVLAPSVPRDETLELDFVVEFAAR